MAFSAAPLLAITALGDLGLTNLLPDPSEWADAGDAYAVDNYAVILASLVLQCLLSSALVVAFHRFKHRALTPGWPLRLRGRKVFRDDNPTDEAPVVRVKTTTASTYTGTLADYRPR